MSNSCCKYRGVRNREVHLVSSHAEKQIEHNETTKPQDECSHIPLMGNVLSTPLKLAMSHPRMTHLLSLKLCEN